MTSTTPDVLASWHLATEHTRSRSPATFDQWFSGVQMDRCNGTVLELCARDEFVRDWVKAHFIPAILEHMSSTLGESGMDALRVEWRICQQIARPVSDVALAPVTARRTEREQDEDPARMSEPSAGSLPPPSNRPGDRRSSRPPWFRVERGGSRLPVGLSLNPKHTFANFVVGPSNQLAYAAALASAGGGGPRYNPLFIAGTTGLGKTHLIHAIAHRVLHERPEARVLYVSAERFTNEFIEALQHQAMDAFRARYRVDCDLLLLDDIQFLAGREQTQEEFFHTFNALRDADKPIVVTSDKYPQQLLRMPERLVSRFTSGLVADIQVPQLETRVAIVKKKAELEGIPVPDQVAVLLAQSVQSNVRELEGALIRLAAKSSLTGRPIDEDFARSELVAVAPRAPALMSVEDIQRAVCTHFRLSNAELLSKDRHKSVAFARQVAMYLCRQRLKCSFPELGRAFGNRDHTTIISAVRRVEALRQSDPRVNAHLEAIEKHLVSSDEG
ncbi:MAG: chromosomal replication initiator protein DnaA [Polyangiaceae bacterium]|nr:chromosomal replication initiator protein DnaA [Polyangiaceae bacterium]